MAESFDDKVSDINQKLCNLIERVESMHSGSVSPKNTIKTPEEEKYPLPPPANPPKKEPLQSTNVRKDLIEELTSYFKKRKGVK